MFPCNYHHDFPTAVVSASDGVVGAEMLLRERPLQIGFSVENILRFSSCSLILDFGSENFGGLRLLVRNSPKDGKIRIKLMKSLDEISLKLPKSNLFTVTTTIYSDMTYANTSFRYAKIDFLAASGEYGIAAVARRNYDGHRLDSPIDE